MLAKTGLSILFESGPIRIQVYVHMVQPDKQANLMNILREQYTK